MDADKTIMPEEGISSHVGGIQVHQAHPKGRPAGGHDVIDLGYLHIRYRNRPRMGPGGWGMIWSAQGTQLEALDICVQLVDAQHLYAESLWAYIGMSSKPWSAS